MLAVAAGASLGQGGLVFAAELAADCRHAAWPVQSVFKPDFRYDCKLPKLAISPFGSELMFNPNVSSFLFSERVHKCSELHGALRHDNSSQVSDLSETLLHLMQTVLARN